MKALQISGDLGLSTDKHTNKGNIKTAKRTVLPCEFLHKVCRIAAQEMGDIHQRDNAQCSTVYSLLLIPGFSGL